MLVDMDYEIAPLPFSFVPGIPDAIARAVVANLDIIVYLKS